MDAACTIQGSIHVFSLVHKYVSRILGTYHCGAGGVELAKPIFYVSIFIDIGIEYIFKKANKLFTLHKDI